jgi:hypothetical protein
MVEVVEAPGLEPGFEMCLTRAAVELMQSVDFAPAPEPMPAHRHAGPG